MELYLKEHLLDLEISHEIELSILGTSVKATKGTNKNPY